MLNLLILVFSLLFALSAAFFSYGCLFGMVALPTLVTKTSHKYGILITGMLVPFFVAFVCLFNYQKTKYASDFLIKGLIGFILSGLFLWGISSI